MAGTTLLFSEVLDKVHKAKTKDQKVNILRQHNTPALRTIMKSSFDPNISCRTQQSKPKLKRNTAN